VLILRRLCAIDVFQALDVQPYQVSGLDELRHQDFDLVFQPGRLPGAVLLAVGRRRGVRDTGLYDAGKDDADRLLLNEFHRKHHLRLEEAARRSDQGTGYLDLFEAHGIHEIAAVGIGVEELQVLFFDRYIFQFQLGAETLFQEVPVEGPEPDMGHAAHLPLAGMNNRC